MEQLTDVHCTNDYMAHILWVGLEGTTYKYRQNLLTNPSILRDKTQQRSLLSTESKVLRRLLSTREPPDIFRSLLSYKKQNKAIRIATKRAVIP